MSWWLNENFSIEHYREKSIKGERALYMVLRYCAVCDALLVNIEPIAEWHTETLEELETNLKFGVYRVNQKGNLVIHRSYGKTCELHSDSNNR